MAPTLFGTNTENCFTSGPSSVEIVCGKLAGIGITAHQTSVDAPAKLSHCGHFVGKPNILVRRLKCRISKTDHDLMANRRLRLTFAVQYGRRKRANRAQTEKA